MQLAIVFPTILSLSFIATLCWLLIARNRLWLDQPNHRSSHCRPTPTSGGIGFVITFAGFVLFLFSWRLINLNDLLLLSSATLLAVTGFVDDLKSLSIRARLIAQVAACAFVVITLDGDPVFTLSETLQVGGVLAKILILAGLLWLVNLYNFMDGIDGLAAAEAIFFSLSFSLFTFVGGNHQVSIIALGLASSLCGFLYFNLPPAKIFMGDLGSNYLGFVLGVIGVLGIVSEAVNVWTILVLLSVFIIDSTTTLIARMRAGLVWYHGHNSHAYQYAARKWKSHGKVVALVCVINIFWLLPLAWLTTLYEEAGLLLTGLAWTPLVVLGLYCRRHWQASLN